MSDFQIPETPNTDNQPLWTVEQAVSFLPLPGPLDRGTLSKLGRDCSMVSRIWKEPTGVVPVVGKQWPSEKSYTRKVLQEVFRRHPATAQYVPKETQE